MFQSRGHGSKLMVPKERSYYKEYTYVKYQSSSTHSSEVFSNVKVFKKWVELQGEDHRVKNNGIHRKVLSQGILM